MRTTLTLAFFGLSSLTLPAHAQTDVVLPRIFGTIEGNDLGRYPFGRTGFRTQILIDSTSFAASNAVVTGLSFRADNNNSIGSPAVTVTNVTISMSQTTFAHTGMNTTFAANITGTPVVVYTGSLNLPAYTSTPGGIAPWTLIPVTPFPVTVPQGNLLIDITAANAGSTTNGYVIDNALPGGGVTNYGTAGQLMSPDPVSVIVSGSGTMGRFSGIVPGGAPSYMVQSQLSAHSGIFMLALRPLATPIDLGAYGMPGSSLYVDPLVTLGYTMVPSGFTYRATFPLSIPADPALIGEELHAQALVVDSLAPGGLAATDASKLRIGEIGHPLQQLNSTDYAAATGSFSYGSLLGGAVVRLSGVYR